MNHAMDINRELQQMRERISEKISRLVGDRNVVGLRIFDLPCAQHADHLDASISNVKAVVQREEGK